MKKNLDTETQKAIVRIPNELNRLTKVIAVIGETLFNAKMEKLELNKKEFEKLVRKEERRGVT